MKKLIALLLALSMVIGCLACTAQPAAAPAAAASTSETAGSESAAEPAAEAAAEPVAAETIKIGAFFNFSGANADTGILDGDGAQFAADWINARGGIKSLGGAQIEIVKGDTLSDSSQAKAVAERVVSENPDIVAAIGAGGSGYTVAMGTVFEKAEIPYVQSGVSASIPAQGYSYTYQPVPNTFGQTQIEFVKYLNENFDYNMYECQT